MLFFELLQIAIGNREKLSHAPTTEEWRELYALAQKQALVGIAFRGVEQLPTEQRPPRALLMQWYMATERIKALNEEMNQQALAVANKFLEEGFPGVVLKGQGIAKLYQLCNYENDDENKPHPNPLQGERGLGLPDEDTQGAELNVEHTEYHPAGNCPPNLGVTSEAEGVYSQLSTLNPQQNYLTQNSQKTASSDSQLAALPNAYVPDGKFSIFNFQFSISNYRTPGDIDIWLHGERSAILEYVRRCVPDCKPVYHHVDFPVVSDVSIEVHFTPTWMNSPLKNHRLQRFFSSTVYNQQTTDNSQQFLPDGDTKHSTLNTKQATLPVPNNAFNRIYILVHIYRHLFAEGIGLKQLLDYYFVLQQGFTEVEREETLRTLRSLGMMRFTRAVMWVLQEVYGLPDRYLLTSPDEEEGRFLLSEIMLAGNFGQHDERLQRAEGEGTFRWGLRKVIRNFRFVRSYPSEVLWSPLFKVWHLFWRMGHA